MTIPRMLPSPATAEWLADLIADATAIPDAAFVPCRSAVPHRIDLTAAARQRSAIAIPDSSVSLLAAAEHCF